MHKIIHKLKEETISAIPAIIYFLIMFNLLHFISNLARQPGDINYFGYWTMTIAALIVGKVMVIVNCFSFVNAFPQKPVVFNVVWKVIIYNLFIILIIACHIFIHQWLKLHNLHLAYDRVLWDMTLPLSWSILILLILTFVGYILFTELLRVLGREQMRIILFGK